MEIHIKGTNLTVTPSLREYIHKKFDGMEKYAARFLKPGSIPEARLEVARTTTHHKKGELFKAQVFFSASAHSFHARYEGEDIRAAIDALKDELARQLVSESERIFSRSTRQARLFKRITHLSPLAWFRRKKGERDREEGM